MSTEAFSAKTQHAPDAQFASRVAEEMIRIRPMLQTLLAIEMSLGHVGEAELIEFLQDQQLVRAILAEACLIRRRRIEAGDQAAVLRKAARECSGRGDTPLVRLGPGGDYVRDFYADDLGEPYSPHHHEGV